MWTRTVIALAALSFASMAFGQTEQTLKFGTLDMPTDYDHAQIDAAFERAIARARSLGLENAAGPREAGAFSLNFPLQMSTKAKSLRSTAISNFVDLDPSSRLKDFSCGQRTYNGHTGIDIAPLPYGWRSMDRNEVTIVAAAPGVIAEKVDGQFDRQCLSSPGGSYEANHVIIRQDDGLLALYWHMKKGSVTKKPTGARVATGEVLGLVGSSGNSGGPHLHFDLRTPARVPVDPWEGRCGKSPQTLWRHQPEDVDTDILKIATHSQAPPSFDRCETKGDPRYANRFGPGDTVWGAVYLRDQKPTTPVTVSIIEPDGGVYATWTSPSVSHVYPYIYWYQSATLPTSGAAGIWKVRATLEGSTREHAFVVGPMPRPTKLRVTRTPPRKTINPNATAHFVVTVRNIGTQDAVGCNIVPDVPLAATWSVLQIVPRVPGRQRDHAVGIPKGQTRKFRLSIDPKPGYRAKAMTFPIHVSCLNANSPPASAATKVTLTY